MKLEKNIGLIAAVLGVITFVDQYFLKSNLLANLSIPESIPTSIFLIVFAVVSFVLFFVSRKEVTLPYPDQRKEVQDLEAQLESCKEEIDGLTKKNEELLHLKSLFDGNENLQDQIHGILLQGSISSDNLVKKLKIESESKDAIANFHAVMGRMGKQGLVSTTSLGYYQLSKNK